MNRRSWIVGVGSILVSRLRLSAAQKLLPLDLPSFHQMIAGHHGKILLVDFWATWCAPCREELPKLVTLHSGLASRGLDFVTISCDEPEQESEAAQFVTKQAAPDPHYIRRAADDDAFINAIDPKWSGALPALFIFDRSSHQVQSFIGETDMKQLDSVLRKLLG